MPIPGSEGYATFHALRTRRPRGGTGSPGEGPWREAYATWASSWRQVVGGVSNALRFSWSLPAIGDWTSLSSLWYVNFPNALLWRRICARERPSSWEIGPATFWRWSERRQAQRGTRGRSNQPVKLESCPHRSRDLHQADEEGHAGSRWPEQEALLCFAYCSGGTGACIRLPTNGIRIHVTRT